MQKATSSVTICASLPGNYYIVHYWVFLWYWRTKYTCQTTQLLTLLSWNAFTSSIRLKVVFKVEAFETLIVLLEWMKDVSRIYNRCILSVNYWLDWNVGFIEFTKTPKTGACGFTWHS